jgi:protein-tyrosine phosphatase
MIDLHTHILPEMDDGAADLETALAMGRYGEERGVEVIAATPHFFG